MNKEQQIEEMACKKCLHFEACQIAFRNSKDLGIYDCTEEEYFNATLDCDYYTDKNIYRKASEVAREIFEEIERIAMSKIDADLSIAVINDIYYIEAIDELKKKYTEDRK